MSRTTVIETKILAVLANRKEEATLEDDLRFMSGVAGLSFKEAMIRLVRKNLVVKWKSENYVNYVVLSEFENEAYYLEPVAVHPLNLLFGTPPESVMVKRSVPFVMLPDPDIRKERHNRYDLAVA
jgi:hypothetical protein